VPDQATFGAPTPARTTANCVLVLDAREGGPSARLAVIIAQRHLKGH
jgi:hypothetical protein